MVRVLILTNSLEKELQLRLLWLAFLTFTPGIWCCNGWAPLVLLVLPHVAVERRHLGR